MHVLQINSMSLISKGLSTNNSDLYVYTPFAIIFYTYEYKLTKQRRTPAYFIRPSLLHLPRFLLPPSHSSMWAYFLLPVYRRIPPVFRCQYHLNQVCPHCMKPIRGKPLHPVPCLAEFIDNLNKNDKE